MKKIDIVVVSLFDGLSGGRIALERTPHLNVLRYYSSEVDKYAIQVADKNYPQDTEFRLGDITKIDGTKLLKDIREEFDDVKILLIGGSPCQGFSTAGKMRGSSTACGIDVTSLEQYLDLKDKDFEFDGQSYLFWEYVRIQKEIDPDYYFLENVAVTKKWLPMFNQTMGTNQKQINSSLVTGQDRDRFYWTNILFEPIRHTRDFIIDDYLQDEDEIDDIFYLSEKALNFMDTFVKDANRIKRGLPLKTRWQHNNINQRGKKAYCLTANMYKGVPYGIIKQEKPRRFTPLECERLQTLPDNYTEGVSNSQRYKMIGNGWTIDVVAHIFSFIK